METIKYYGLGDWSSYGYFKSSVDYVNDCDVNNIASMTINEILCLFNVISNLKDKDLVNGYGELLNAQNRQKLERDIIPRYHRRISQIESKEIPKLKNYVIRDYDEDFWRWISIDKLRTLSSNDFKTIIEEDNDEWFYILIHANIVNKYGTEIRNFFIKNSYCGKYILEHFKETGPKLYLPDINIRDINLIMEKLIDILSDDSPYLKQISEFGHKIINNSKISLNRAIISKANNKMKNYNNKLWESADNNNNMISFGLKIEFTEEIGDRFCEITQEGNVYIKRYNPALLVKGKSNIELLQNFLCPFIYFDKNCCINLVAKKNDNSLVDMLVNEKIIGNYNTNTAFEFADKEGIMTMVAYCHYLDNYAVPLEELLEWYFQKYIVEEFGVCNFSFKLSNLKEIPYESRIVALCAKLDSILKQYNIFVEYGKFDFDLMDADSVPVKFENVKSLLAKKYIRLLPRKIDGLLNILFSDQNTIHYVERFNDKHYRCFANMISNEIVYLNDIHDFDIPALNLLIEYGLIILRKDNSIAIKDSTQIKILGKLYDSGVLNYWYCGKKGKKYIDVLLEKGYCVLETGLFNKDEIDYLNYNWNNKFNNSLAIRNKYAHGNELSLTEKQHEENYYRVMMIMVMVTMKIHDDLCVYYDMN